MSFTVRIFGYRGLSQIPHILAKQFASDSVYCLTQPYEYAERITVSSVAANSIPTTTEFDHTTILHIQIPDGQSVRYEVNPPQRFAAQDANIASPLISGHVNIEFRPGWGISFIDAAGLP